MIIISHFRTIYLKQYVGEYIQHTNSIIVVSLY